MAVFLQKVSDEVLRKKYSNALKLSQGRVYVAARIVGHSRPTFYKYAKRLKLIEEKKPLTVKFNGKTKPLSEWSKILDIPYTELYQRLRRMPAKKAFTLPYEKKAA
jgi:ACT domain-containing protein